MHTILSQKMMKNHEKLGKMPTFLVENSREFPKKNSRFREIFFTGIPGNSRAGIPGSSTLVPGP